CVFGVLHGRQGAAADAEHHAGVPAHQGGERSLFVGVREAAEQLAVADVGEIEVCRGLDDPFENCSGVRRHDRSPGSCGTSSRVMCAADTDCLTRISIIPHGWESPRITGWPTPLQTATTASTACASAGHRRFPSAVFLRLNKV